MYGLVDNGAKTFILGDHGQDLGHEAVGHEEVARLPELRVRLEELLGARIEDLAEDRPRLGHLLLAVLGFSSLFPRLCHDLLRPLRSNRGDQL